GGRARGAGPGGPPAGGGGPRDGRPPRLWGVASSAPSLHDGRAPTLNEAIRLHGGEAAATSGRYAQLTTADRQCLLAFLHSLAGPPCPRPPASKSAKRSATAADLHRPGDLGPARP